MVVMIEHIIITRIIRVIIINVYIRLEREREREIEERLKFFLCVVSFIDLGRSFFFRILESCSLSVDVRISGIR